MNKTPLLLFLLTLCSFYNLDSPTLKNGVYCRSSDWNLVNPHLKIDGQSFKFYDYGHTGSEYGWGKYKINSKDSTITFYYKEFHGNRFYPLKNYKEKKRLMVQDHYVGIEGYKTDSSEFMNKHYDSLFLECKKYVDKAFLMNKKKKRVKHLRKEDW